jgi:hypothetical protein
MKQNNILRKFSNFKQQNFAPRTKIPLSPYLLICERFRAQLLQLPSAQFPQRVLDKAFAAVVNGFAQ